jgi:hypothetical protein
MKFTCQSFTATSKRDFPQVKMSFVACRHSIARTKADTSAHSPSTGADDGEVKWRTKWAEVN